MVLVHNHLPSTFCQSVLLMFIVMPGFDTMAIVDHQYRIICSLKIHIELGQRSVSDERKNMRSMTSRCVANSENVVGVHKPMCMCISFFVSKTVGEIRSFVRSIAKIQLKQVNHDQSSADGRSTHHQHGDSARPPTILRKVWFSVGQVEEKKKASFLDRRTLLLSV